MYSLIKRGILRVEEVEGLGWLIPEGDYHKAIEVKESAPQGSKPFYGLGKGFKRVHQLGRYNQRLKRLKEQVVKEG